jgi:hypothetical protein
MEPLEETVGRGGLAQPKLVRAASPQCSLRTRSAQRALAVARYSHENLTQCDLIRQLRDTTRDTGISKRLRASAKRAIPIPHRPVINVRLWCARTVSGGGKRERRSEKLTVGSYLYSHQGGIFAPWSEAAFDNLIWPRLDTPNWPHLY